MFGGQRNANNQQLKAAKLEMQAVTDSFGKMTETCYKKCFVGKSNLHNGDPELNVGELTCTDRCVGKYLEAQKKVGETMNNFQQQQAQIQQQMQQNLPQ